MKEFYVFFKRIFAAALVLVMLISSINTIAFAAVKKSETFYIEDSHVNSVYYDDFADESISGSYKTKVKYADNSETAMKRAAAEKIRDNMIARKENFSMVIKSTRTDYSNLVEEIFKLAVSEELANSAVAGDYLAWQYGGYSFSGSASVEDDVYVYSFNFKVSYYTTASQEAKVTSAVNNAIGKMNINNLDTYNKVKSVYDYVCRVCNYDNSTSNDHTRFTAYGAIISGKAVCQGYSLLLYRMLEEIGIDNKIITSATHSWNIVDIDGNYYNLDPTWDDNYYDQGLGYQYFLKCPAHFSGHDREAQYKTSAFNAKYPMTDQCLLDSKKTRTINDCGTVEVPKKTVAAANMTSVKGVVNGFAVAWSKISDVTGYQIQYSTRSDFTGAATVYAGDKNATSKTVTGRAANTTYYVRVRAYLNDNGEYIYGAWSSGKPVKTLTNAPATATISSVATAVNGFTVKWNKISGVTGYQLQYSTKSNFSGAATVYAGNANATSKTVTGRAANTRYYVRVRAYKNINGTYVYGNWSTGKNVTTTSKPGKPTLKSVGAVSKGFTVNWNKVSGVTGYQIQYSTRSNFSGAATVYGGNGNAVSKKITGRGAKTKYYVRVRAYKNVNGTYVYGDWSASKAVTTK